VTPWTFWNTDSTHQKQPPPKTIVSNIILLNPDQF